MERLATGHSVKQPLELPGWRRWRPRPPAALQHAARVSQARTARNAAGHAQHRLRAAQGVLCLGERYGAARLDAACQRTLAAGDASYRTVKCILAAGLEAVPLPRPPAARPPGCRCCCAARPR